MFRPLLKSYRMAAGLNTLTAKDKMGLVDCLCQGNNICIIVKTLIISAIRPKSIRSAESVISSTSGASSFSMGFSIE